MRIRLSFFLTLIAGIMLLGASCRETYVQTNDGSYVRQNTDTAETITADLRITKAADTSSLYRVSGLEEQTVLGVLRKGSEEQGFAIVVDTSSDLGAFVSDIDGVGNRTDRYWQYYVNGEYGKVAADRMTIRDGDLVEWKYDTNQFIEEQ